MKTIIKTALFLSLTFSTSAFAAWVHSPNVTVKEIIQWEGSGKIYITLSNGKRCFIENADDKNYALFLSLYVSQKKVEFHCYPQEVIRSGVKGHKFHRVIARQ